MKRKKLIFIVLGSVILVTAIIFVILKFAGGDSSELVAKTVRVKKGNISTIVTATGKVEPVLVVNVGTQVSGVVQKIYADYNSRVIQGQLIAELDKTNLKASVVVARANLNNALNEMEYLQKIYDRQNALYKSNTISQADYEEALYKLNAAKNAVEQGKSDLSRAETNLGYADIYSPIDGVILSKSVDVGQTVAASFSTPTLFVIAKDLSKMQVEANVDEADIGNVREGQRVVFTVDAYTGEEFNGLVTQVRLNATVTSSVVTYTVIITADNPDQKLMPGLTATISIYTDEINDVVTLESRAFNFKADTGVINKYNRQKGVRGQAAGPSEQRMLPPGGPSENMKIVWVKDGMGIHPQPLKTGKSDGVNVQVMDGLRAGEEVVYEILTAAEVTNDNTMPSIDKSPFMPEPPGRKKK